MNSWILFWTIIYIVGCTLGALMVILIIPFGFRDLFRLYHLLNADKAANQASEDQPPPGA